MTPVGPDSVKENFLLNSAIATITGKGFQPTNTSTYLKLQKDTLIFVDEEMIEVAVHCDEESQLIRVEVVLPIIPQSEERFISFCGFQMNDGLLERTLSLSVDQIENLASEIDEARIALRGIEAGFSDDLMTVQHHSARQRALVRSMGIGAMTGGVCALIAAALSDLAINSHDLPLTIEDIRGWLGFSATAALLGTLIQVEIDARAGKFNTESSSSHHDDSEW